ncbi:hypothetical protein GCM10025865_08550 [Paraoerskovia sediminicola]|uniref:Uncharacterized protein n=1 Tax=Paraoerskovia sediminicola TaxID=1138587 RepID=A0ABN6X9V0_9CELL|nr:hypothetical protein [Paraoerskovia sediminicola]BDZ41556.1 hypothetical protein GCM10025865_08550 [Paraoerskovia sediminicola]
MSSDGSGDRPDTQSEGSPEQVDGVDLGEAEVEDVVDVTTVRRAPRYKAFFWTGALAGIVLGLALGLSMLAGDGGDGLLKPGVFLTVIVLGTTTFTVLLAGVLVLLADRRSLRRRGRSSR